MDDEELRFWGFKCDPFEDGPRPEWLYLSGAHREAIEALRRAVSEGKKAIYLSGPAGSGKSFLLAVVHRWLERQAHLVCLVPETDTGKEEDVLKPLLRALGFNLRAIPLGETVAVLKAFLARTQRDRGAQSVLLIDRANFPSSRPARAQIEELLTFQREGVPLLTVAFTGRQPPAEAERLVSNSFWQTVEVAHLLGAMQPHETAQYIEHRLRLAGCWEKLFDPDACFELHRQSAGLPGWLNTLGREALARARARGSRHVTADLICVETPAPRVAEHIQVTEPRAHAEAEPEAEPLPAARVPLQGSAAVAEGAAPAALERPPLVKQMPAAKEQPALASPKLHRAKLPEPSSMVLRPPWAHARSASADSSLRSELRRMLERQVLKRSEGVDLAPIRSSAECPHEERPPAPAAPDQTICRPVAGDKAGDATSPIGVTAHTPAGSDSPPEERVNVILTHFLRKRRRSS